MYDNLEYLCVRSVAVLPPTPIRSRDEIKKEKKKNQFEKIDTTHRAPTEREKKKKSGKHTLCVNVLRVDIYLNQIEHVEEADVDTYAVVEVL